MDRSSNLNYELDEKGKIKDIRTGRSKQANEEKAKQQIRARLGYSLATYNTPWPRIVVKRPSSSNDDKEHLKSSDQSTNRQIKQDNGKSSLYADSRQTFQSSSKVSKITSTHRKSLKPSRSSSTLNDKRSIDPSSKSDNVETRQGTLPKRRVSISRKQNSPVRQTVTSTVDSTRRFSSNAASSSMTQQGAAVSKKHYSPNIHGAETTRRSSTSLKHPIRSPTKKRSFKNESHSWKAVNERHPLRSQAQSNDFYNEKDHGTKRKREEEPMTRTSNLKKRRIQSRSLYEGKIAKFVSYQGHPYGFVTSEGISHEERQIYCIGTTDIHFSFRCVLSSLLELQTGDIVSFKLQEPRTKRKDRVRAVNVTVLQLSKRSYRVLKDYLTRVEDALDSKEEGSDIRETFGYGDLFIDSDDARLGDSDVDEHANGNESERETVHESVESDMNQSAGSGDRRLTKNKSINIEKEPKLWHDECEEDDRLLVNSTPVSKQRKLDMDFINIETGDYRLSCQNVRLSSPDDEVFETSNASGRGWKNERDFTKSIDIDPIDIHDTLPPHNAEVSNENSPVEKQLASQFEINRSPYHGIKRDRKSGSPQLKDRSIPRRSRREVSRKPEACKQFQTKDVLSSPTVWQHVIKQISSSHDNHQTLIQQYLRVVVKLCEKTQSLKELFRQVLMKIAEEATFLNPISGSLRRYIDQLMKDIERESKKGDTKDDSEDTLHPGRDFHDTEAEFLNQDVEEKLGECSSFQGGLDDVQESTNGYMPNSPKFVNSKCERMLLESGSETEEEVAGPSDEEGRPTYGDCKNEEVRESIDLEDGEIVDVDEKRKAKLITMEIYSSNQSEKRVNSLLASPIDGTSKIFNKQNDDLIDENKTVRKNNSRQRRGDNGFKSKSTLRENLKLVRDFLLVISRTIPEKRSTILSLVKILMRRSHLQHQNLEMSIFLYNLLKTFTVGSLDNIDDLQWLDLPLILKKDEIFNELEEAINLRAVKKKGCYESADEYMDVYFRLLREDCFYNLKKSIKQLINGELDIRDMNVYEKVSLYGINVAKGSVQFALKIFSIKDVKDWSRSSHLKFGDLMCLSTDGTFKQQFWVTVTSKDHMQEKGVVLVQPCDEWNDFKGAEFMIHLMRSKGHIYMVESPNYYRSYQPVFKTLQSLNVNRLSFKEELVKLEKGRLPDFLNPSHTIDSRLVYRTPTIPDTSEPRKAKATSNSTINHDSPESNKPIVAVNSLSSLPPNQTDSATNQINATTSSLAVTSNSVASEIAKSQSMSPPTTQTSSFKMQLKKDIMKLYKNIMKPKKDIFLPPTPPQLLPPTPPQLPPTPPKPPPPLLPPKPTQLQLPPRDRAFTMQREDEKHKITLEEFFDTPHSDVKSIFDPSQEEAVKTCLQNRIGIIQGPPGCGKTFIGVQMVRLLLSLSSLYKPKIFVLTYKNHALDEFLKGISKYVGPSKLVRIGGRCKDPALENITLRKLRKENQTEITEMVFKNRYEMDESRNTLRATFEEIRQLPYISYDQLYRSLSDAHVYSLLISLDWDSLSSEETNCVTWQEVDNLLRGENSKSFEDIKFLYEIKDIAFNHWLPSQEEFDDCEHELTGGIQSIQTFSKLTFKQPSEIDKVKKKKKGEKDEENGETMKSEEEIMEAEEEQMMFSEQRRSEFVNEEFNSILKVDDGNSNHQGEQRVKGFCPQAIKKLTENGYNLPYFDEQEDVWQLSMPDRIRLVQLLIAKETNEMLEKFQRSLREFKDECKQKAELETQNEVEILKRKQIIAATVTGASINQELLREIKPQIVIVEEAAEVLEPQLVASIGSWTKYMLLIGDHQQLRPSVDAYHLRKDYNFDISMMERLINNQMPYTTLQMQNRQRVEFAELLLDIYPNLKTNHKRISGHKPATCLEKSVFFWDHQHEETKERSVRNEEEAKRAVDLGLFLVQQGYEPRKITILAMYRGQTKLIRDMIREHVKIYSQLFSCDTRMNKLQAAMTTHADNRKSTTILESKQKQKAKEKPDEPNVIKIHTVDMYQGDENDFVIVSLVRSNRERNIGFLSERNRRCVAQSRARCGVYFIGNSSMFKEHKTWRPLIFKLESDGCLGDKIGLVCKDHPEASFKVKDSKLMALPKLKNFCQQPCGREMDCGKHFCKEGCQVPHTHLKSACKELVLFEDERCQLHHEPYQRPCCSLRNFCKKLVPFTFEKCGHDAFKECYKKAAWLECETPVLHAMVCGHVQSKQCHEDGSKIKCKEKCQREMSCGHICSGGHKCFEHSNKKSCRDCTNIERAERKKRRKAEEEQRKANERNVKEHIKKLENSEDFEKIKCTELTRKNPETIEKYLRIQVAVKKAINQGHRLFPKITKIEEVRNLKVHAKFLEKSLRLYENEIKSESKLFFHGLNDTMLESILKDGFTLPDEGRSYGAGIYLTSDSTQSRNESQSDQSGKMLYCQVHLGRSWTAKEESPDFNAESLRKLKKDSVFAPRSTKEEGGESLSDQYIVFNPDQVLPSYVISYDLEFQPSFIEVFGPDFATSKKTILPKREFNTDDVLQKHFKFVEARFLNMLNKVRKTNVYEITKIDFYENPALKERFLGKQREFEDKYPNSSEAEPIYGFHGTYQSDVVCEIMNNNFKASTRGKFGAGVYFSEQPDYTFNYGGKNNLILARILPGKTKECNYVAMNSDLCTEGYESHGAFKNDDGTFKEVVIFDTEQILPCYVIHFKLV